MLLGTYNEHVYSSVVFREVFAFRHSQCPVLVHAPSPLSRQNGRISSLEEKLRDVVMEMATFKSNYLVGVVKLKW